VPLVVLFNIDVIALSLVAVATALRAGRGLFTAEVRITGRPECD
jgi:hypothetical protein